MLYLCTVLYYVIVSYESTQTNMTHLKGRDNGVVGTIGNGGVGTPYPRGLIIGIPDLFSLPMQFLS